MSKALVPVFAAAALLVSSVAFVVPAVAEGGCSGGLRTVSTPEPVTTADTTTTPVIVKTQPSG